MNFSKIKNRLAKRKGITLVELALVLALAAIVVFVALRAYSQAQENSKVQQTASEIGQVRGAVESIYANSSSYGAAVGDSLNTSIVNSLPASYTSGTSGITDPFQGSVSVAVDKVTTEGDSYDIIVGGLTTDACERLATLDMGKSVVGVAAGSSGSSAIASVVSNSLGTLPIVPTLAASVCSIAATGNYVGFAFQ